MTVGIKDGCEWHPSGRPARGHDRHHQTTAAEVVLGTDRSRVLVPDTPFGYKWQIGNWRVCMECSKHEAFKRLRKTVRIS
jgi:hypothetical protein